MSTIVFLTYTFESTPIFVDDLGYHLYCVETMLKAKYPEGRILGVIEKASWGGRTDIDNYYFQSFLGIEPRYFVSTAKEVEKDRSKFTLRILVEELEVKKKALEAFVKLPSEFIDFVVKHWEREHQNTNYRDEKSKNVEAERLELIHKAIER